MLALAMAACAPAAAPVTSAEPLLVAAAADLQFAFPEIGALYKQQTGRQVTFTFGSTGQLEQQIENGAPYDLFAAADVSYIEQLNSKSLILPDTRQLYAQGRIVLAVNKQSGLQVTELKQLSNPAIKQIAIANPDHAPYGAAAMQALASAGLWEQLKPKLVYGDNITQALQFIR